MDKYDIAKWGIDIPISDHPVMQEVLQRCYEHEIKRQEMVAAEILEMCSGDIVRRVNVY